MAETKPKPIVYLAGPISNCNEAQRAEWRREVKSLLAQECDFIDPVENLKGPNLPHYKVIEADEKSVRKCDAVFANMWKESIGTAIGVVNASRLGKIVVVVDPNYIQSRTLAFLADATVYTLQDGVEILKTLLRMKDLKFFVEKQNGVREKFNREKLFKSLRNACNAAGKSDILVPREVIPLALQILIDKNPSAEKVIRTTQIKEAVWQVLVELESDPSRQNDFYGVRNAWEEYDKKIGKTKTEHKNYKNLILENPQNIVVKTPKSHSSIWGKNINSLNDIPEPARRVFKNICRVQGVSNVILTRFGKGKEYRGNCEIKLSASKTHNIIEGNCYDNGKKGKLQCFQIRIHDHNQRDDIMFAIQELLYLEGYIKRK